MTQRNICTMNKLYFFPIIIQFAFLILIPSVQAQTSPWQLFGQICQFTSPNSPQCQQLLLQQQLTAARQAAQQQQLQQQQAFLPFIPTTIDYHYNQSSNRKCRHIADSSFWSFGYIKWWRLGRFDFHFEWGSDSGKYYFVRLDTGFRYDCITEWSKYNNAYICCAYHYQHDFDLVF